MRVTHLALGDAAWRLNNKREWVITLPLNSNPPLNTALLAEGACSGGLSALLLLQCFSFWRHDWRTNEVSSLLSGEDGWGFNRVPSGTG